MSEYVPKRLARANTFDDSMLKLQLEDCDTDAPFVKGLKRAQTFISSRDMSIAEPIVRRPSFNYSDVLFRRFFPGKSIDEDNREQIQNYPLITSSLPTNHTASISANSSSVISTNSSRKDRNTLEYLRPKP